MRRWPRYLKECSVHAGWQFGDEMSRKALNRKTMLEMGLRQEVAQFGPPIKETTLYKCTEFSIAFLDLKYHIGCEIKNAFARGNDERQEGAGPTTDKQA